jgi:BASS family bile acid:Na+ symporter
MTTVALPIALGILMFGLGLTLTTADFTRVGKHPRVVLVALACQVLVLPSVCFLLVLAFDLPPVLAVGMMLLAASPGGTTANLYSHLFRGDVALNISLTAVNSVLSVFTLPLVVNLSLQYFLTADEQIGIQFGKALEVFAIVLLPVALGMLVRRLRPQFAAAMLKPVRIGSLVILILVVAGAILANREILAENFGRLSLITISFCAISLALGYLVPRALKSSHPASVACAFEIGIHNATLAVVLAQTVLDSVEMSLPAGVYGVLMFFIAAAFGFLVSSKSAARRANAPA